MKICLKTAYCLLVVSLCCLLNAQTNSSPASVPHLVNYSGKLIGSDGKPVSGLTGVTFALYKDQDGGSPLWLETQNVALDSQGRFTVQLGASKSQGLPTELFSSGEARWLGVQASGMPEQARVLLLSVPYALKAADAETIGGLPATAFVLATPGAAGSSAAGASSGTNSLPPVGGSGTQDFVPLWTDNSGKLGNSILFQLGSGKTAKIGINNTNPLTTLDVNGSTLVRGKLETITSGFATATKGFNSYPMDLEASSFSSKTQKGVMQHFEWQAEPTGNNTNAPGATLNLLFTQDNNAFNETGLRLSNTGLFTFAPGQTFPGAGTVTSVGMSAPSSDFQVSGSPVTTSGTLGLTWKVNPTDADTASAIVKRDANGGFSSGAINSVIANGGTYAVSGTNSAGIGMFASGDTDGGTGIYATAGSYGVYGSSTSGAGTIGVSSSYYGVIGLSTTGNGVYGSSPGGDGVFGLAEAVGTAGIEGMNTTAGGSGVKGTGLPGGYFQGVSEGPIEGGEGVFVAGGSSNNTYGGIGGIFLGGPSFNNSSFGGDGIVAVSGFPAGENIGVYAGDFGGDVLVEGNLSKSGGSFKIDHPIDPANKYLYHSFVESPDMMNIYNGNVTTDNNGNAEVHLPDWFEPLNRDFRYQLTVIGQFAQAMVSREIDGSRFSIRTDKPNVKVSWQVTGIRQDAWANAHRIPVEESKPERERGFYIHPELYGAPTNKGLGWARHPQMMQKAAEPHGNVPKNTKVLATTSVPFRP